MILNNPPKALIILVALICVTILISLDKIDPGAGMSVIGLIVGYGIGNGIAAKNGENVEPILSTTRRDRRQDDESQ